MKIDFHIKHNQERPSEGSFWKFLEVSSVYSEHWTVSIFVTRSSTQTLFYMCHRVPRLLKISRYKYITNPRSKFQIPIIRTTLRQSLDLSSQITSRPNPPHCILCKYSTNTTKETIMSSNQTSKQTTNQNPQPPQKAPQVEKSGGKDQKELSEHSYGSEEKRTPLVERFMKVYARDEQEYRKVMDNIKD